MSTLKIKNRLAKDKLMLWGICLFAALTAVPLLARILLFSIKPQHESAIGIHIPPSF